MSKNETDTNEKNIIVEIMEYVSFYTVIVIIAVITFLVIENNSYKRNLKINFDDFEFKSQWESTEKPEVSCGLSIITNINNIEKKENKSLDVMRGIYPPDYNNYYTIEYIAENLYKLGIPSEMVGLKESDEDYSKKLKDNYIIMLIDNFYIENTNDPKTNIGKTYKDSFKHYILAFGTKKIKGEDYIKVFDPYEKENGIRYYNKKQLQKAINNHTDFGYIISNKKKR